MFLAEDIHPTKSNNQKQSNDNITENGNGNSMEKVLSNLTEKLQSHHSEVIQNESNYKTLESPIQGPDRSRLTLFIEGDYCSLLLELFRAVLEAQKPGGESVNCLSKAFELFCQMTQHIIKSTSQSLKKREEFFEKLVSIIEVIICAI